MFVLLHVYRNTDSAIELVLRKGDPPVARTLDDVTKAEVIVFDSVGQVSLVLDSIAHPTMFDLTTTSQLKGQTVDTLTVRLGLNGTLSAGLHKAHLVIHDSEYVNGYVWQELHLQVTDLV